MDIKNIRYQIRQCAVIILAAGRSSRLGSPKQLLIYQEQSLLQHSINIAKSLSANPVIVVLGSTKDKIAQETDLDGVIIAENHAWEAGIASSVKCGLNTLLEKHPQTDAVILMVCDQPFVDQNLLNSLIDTQKASGKGIICCSYDETVGTPVLFHQSFFEELLQLEGDTGAKKIILKHKDQSLSVPFSKGSIDIDTIDDYKNLAK